jgi:lysozyme
MSALDEAISLSADLCKHFEGFRSKPYICPAGYWTIGYGTVYKPDGSKVTMDHPAISKAEAEGWLLHELRYNYAAGVLRASPKLIHHPGALGAMIDFAYNLGTARYRASTLRRRINESDWDGAKEQLSKWVRGGGKALPGLVRRRAAEARLF